MKALNTMILSMMLAASEAIAANGPYFLEATMTPADGIVKRGESVALTYKLQKDGQPAVGEKLRITLKWEGQVVKQETVETTAETAKIEYASDKPGWLYMAFEVLDANGKQVPNPGSQIRQGPKKNLLYEIGAMFEPEGIIAKPSCPKDFEAFWATERKRLQDLPMDVKRRCRTPRTPTRSIHSPSPSTASAACPSRDTFPSRRAPRRKARRSLPII